MTAPEDSQNVAVEIDAGRVVFRWTDIEPPGDEFDAVFPNFTAAKAFAQEMCGAERDVWVRALRDIRQSTKGDIV